jgi:ABC-type amino acid transport substrate-binding protein
MIRAGELDGPEPALRFLREAELIARLRHPNIVQIYDIGQQDGRPYVELEYVEGGSLDRRLGGAPWPTGAAARLVEALAHAIEEAHRQGIVHRDLKPANVLLDAEGQPKIADFGLAKRLEGGADQTIAGAILGTPSYMAPEQAAGGGRGIGPAVDVYALGAILYELLTGRPPFRAASTLETLIQVRERDPVRPRSIDPAVPRDLEVICLKAIAKEPSRRYPSAHALAEDLARFLDGRPIQARPIRNGERFWRWCGRNPAIAGLSAAAIVLLSTVVLLASGMTPPWGDGSLRRVRHAGKLVIATDPHYRPMEFELPDGRLVGFDLDLARQLAHRLGVRAKFVAVEWDWDRLVKRLDSHDFDMVISTVMVTDERDRRVDFVEYWQTRLVFVCRRGVIVRSGRDLAGKVVAVQRDTIALGLVKELKRKGVAIGKIVEVSGTFEPLMEVQRGAAEVALVHEPVGLDVTRQDGGLTITGSVGHVLDSQPLGIVFSEEDKELQAAVARAIKDMRQDESFEKLLEDWFGR